MGANRYLLALSETDPVARAVGDRWGTPPSTGEFVDGAPIRALSEGVGLLRRAGPHVHDDRLDARLPAPWRDNAVPIVFPSIHRSESGTDCFTVHPLGNFSASHEIGGEGHRLTPAPARLMAAALRALDEQETATGLSTTYEATHHGPLLSVPACFVEIGFAGATTPPPTAVVALADSLVHLVESPEDEIVVGIGGGHYAPHFTELALERRWAFGHIVPRHAIESEGERAMRLALEGTPGATGAVFARAGDVTERLSGLGPRRRDTEAPRRTRVRDSRGAARPSGT